MSKLNLKTIMYFALIITVFLIGGCGGPTNLIKTGVYGVEESSPSGIIFSQITAYQDKDDFVVSGKLKRLYTSKSYPGHVDIAIIAPNGDIIETTSVKNKMPFNIVSRRKFSSFKAKFNTTPPEGYQIHVSFHRKGTTNQFKCSDNHATEEHDES